MYKISLFKNTCFRIRYKSDGLTLKGTNYNERYKYMNTGSPRRKKLLPNSTTSDGILRGSQ